MSNWRRSTVSAAIVAIVLMAAFAPCSSEEDPTRSAEIEAEVRKLLVDLGAPTRAVRGAATKRLLDLGPRVLPYLPPPELLSSVSVRESVDRVRHELERRHAQTSTQASQVTLTGTRPLTEWLEEISLQTGNNLDRRGLPAALQEMPLTFEGASHEFWPLLDELASRGGLTFDASGSARGLRLQPRSSEVDKSPEVVGYAGPFRLTAHPFAIVPVGERQEPPDAISRKRLARIVLSVQPEPRLRPLFLQYAMADLAAAAKEAGKLRPFSPDASYELAISEPGDKSNLQLDYLLPQGELPAALDLQGNFRVTVAAGSAAIRFDNVTKRADGRQIGIDRRRGGVTVTLARVRREESRGKVTELRVQIAIAYDSGGPAFESHRTWMLHNEVFLETADGMRQDLNGGFETTMETDGAAGMEYRFVGLPDPLPEYNFVYVAPTLIVDVPVEFALKSIPTKRLSARR